MPLIKLDIQRIMKLGYKLEDFTFKTRKGWRLKNKDGNCVFLSEGDCGVYPFRPEGCRLYPLIHDESGDKPVLDRLCPYRHEFMIREADIRRLMRLIKRLKGERAW